MSRRSAMLSLYLTLAGAATFAAFWWQRPSPEDVMSSDLPVPPFPPRGSKGSTYESCLSSLAEDPAGAMAVADDWQSRGGGDGAGHCQGLALIALGKPDIGASVLEQRAQPSTAPALARAS